MAISTLNARPVVDPTTGNINLQGRGGVTIAFQCQDANAAFIDISAWALFFEIKPGTRAALTAGADRFTRLIVIGEALAASLPLNTALPFAVRDETAEPNVVRWAGVIRTYGYNASP